MAPGFGRVGLAAVVPGGPLRVRSDAGGRTGRGRGLCLGSSGLRAVGMNEPEATHPQHGALVGIIYFRYGVYEAKKRNHRNFLFVLLLFLD
ncbi:hypothetical protein NN561_014432 [Cricetulus griseus]